MEVVYEESDEDIRSIFSNDDDLEELINHNNNNNNIAVDKQNCAFPSTSSFSSIDIDVGEDWSDCRKHIEGALVLIEKVSSTENLLIGDQGIRTREGVQLYPVAGAVLGSCLGGPVGFLAGIKIGGLAAVGGGILGKFLAMSND